MITETSIPEISKPLHSENAFSPQSKKESIPEFTISSPIVKGWKNHVIRLRISWRMFRIALRCYPSLRESIMAFRKLHRFKKRVFGKGFKLQYSKVDGKYYWYQYFPGFPSYALDRHIEMALHHQLPFNKKVNRLLFVFLAITKKCPLRCEHCFEWDNLNQKETLSLDDLKSIVKKFQDIGLAQIHLSGGEPLVRIHDLIELISTADRKSEFWILTSGFNLTVGNATRLKKAGATGIILSLDHFDPSLHNSFRGFSDSFEWVERALINARNANLVTAVSLCATKAFTTKKNLWQYAETVKKYGVSFIQLLEPRAVGHYAGKDVLLDEEHIQILESFYTEMNAIAGYPTIEYHGYYQRRIGCFGSGDRYLYINPNGEIQACPFCSMKAGNILQDNATELLESLCTMSCSAYGKIDLKKSASAAYS